MKPEAICDYSLDHQNIYQLFFFVRQEFCTATYLESEIMHLYFSCVRIESLITRRSKATHADTLVISSFVINSADSLPEKIWFACSLNIAFESFVNKKGLSVASTSLEFQKRSQRCLKLSFKRFSR